VSRIEKFVIGKGVTSRPSEAEEWTRRYLELTVRLPEETSERDFYESLLRAERIIDDYLSQMETLAIPSLDIAEVQQLPWTSYQTKQPCTRPDESGWILSDPGRHEAEKQGVVKELRRAIEKAPNQKLVLGEMLYTLSGQEKQFITRRKTLRRGK